MNEQMWKTDNKELIIKKLTVSELQALDITEGFTWIKSSGEKGKLELRKIFRKKLKEGAEILVLVEKNKIVGFAIIDNWANMPHPKALNALEIAQPYRGKGFVNILVQRIIKEWHNILALMPSYNSDLVEVDTPIVQVEKKVKKSIAI
ncbi:MAG: GNAT family N-acetyltransferase [Candidatus Methylarchaceae archaeon HK02M2]|nr:GNAT family N-acetyltransferase [Candidatus Methylarchaceae archaeon HK02M2]